MAQYTITHICGHQTTENITGTDVHSERTRRADFLASRPCPTCLREEELSAAQAQTAALPALTGTDKQVAWATTIRAKDLADLDERIAKRAAGLERETALLPAQCAAQLAFSAGFREAAAAETSANNWIDGRGGLGRRHDEQLGDLVDAQLAEIKPLAEAAGMTVTEYVQSGQAAQDQAHPERRTSAAETAAGTPAPIAAGTPAPKTASEPEAQTALMDMATAQRLADVSLARIWSWWEPEEVAALPGNLADGPAEVRGLVEDVIAAEPLPYGPEATALVLSALTVAARSRKMASEDLVNA